MRKMLIYLITAFFLLFPVLGLRAEEISLTLDETVSIALRDNREILLRAEDVKKAKTLVAEATASLYPALSVSGSWSDTRSLYARDVDAYSSNVRVRQLLYKGGQVISAIKIGEYNYTAAQAALDTAKQEIIYATKSAFYALMLADKYSALNQEIVANGAAHLAVIEARFQSGEASESDLIKMKANLANVSQAYEASQNQVKAAQALLNNLLFLEKDIALMPAGEFSWQPRDVAFDEAFLKALKERPEIRQLDAQVKMARENIEVARANARPSVYGSWDYYSSSRLGGGIVVGATPIKNWNDYNVIGITVSWPIFDGWMTKAKVDQALIDVKSMQLAKDKTAKAVALDVKTAYVELASALAKTRSVAEETRVYEDNLSVIAEKHKFGFASQLDLHDARLSCRVAEFNQAQANYDYTIAKAKFDKATGGAI